GHGIPQISADSLIDARRALVTLLHEVLHVFEFFWQGNVGIYFDASRGEQTFDALLREVLHAAAVVARPLVPRRVGIVIDRNKCQFVNPGSDVALAVDVTARSAGTHGNS